MAFYQEMQDMVKDLLKPDTEGGLGQVTAVLVRTTPGAVDPEHPEVEVPPNEQKETLRAVASGPVKYADGVTILATDYKIVAAIPALDWRMPEAPSRASLHLELDGRKVSIVSVRGIPAIGAPAAVEFIARM